MNLSVAFIAVSFLLTLNDSLDNLHSVLGTDHFKAECDKLFSCFSAQLLVQCFQLRMIAVDVGFIHILEDIVHFVVSALLAGCLAFILIYVYRVNIQKIRARILTRVSTQRTIAQRVRRMPATISASKSTTTPTAPKTMLRMLVSSRLRIVRKAR